MPVDEFPVRPASSHNSTSTDLDSLFTCRSSRTRGSSVFPVLNCVPTSLRSAFQWPIQAPVALSRTESPTRSIHRRHPRLFCFGSHRCRRAVPPYLVQHERRGLQLGEVLPYVCVVYEKLVSTTKTINARTSNHRGCSQRNSASGATYRTMRRASYSFPFAHCCKTCSFSLFYTIVPIWCPLVC